MNQNIVVPLYDEPINKIVCGKVISCRPEIIISPEKIMLLLCKDPQWLWHCSGVDVVAVFRVSKVLMHAPVDIITLNYNAIFWAFSGKGIDSEDKIEALNYLLANIDNDVYTEILNNPIPETLRPYKDLSNLQNQRMVS